MSKGTSITQRVQGRARREFLTRLPAVVASGLVAPALLNAEQAAAPPPTGVTAETLAAAQQVAGVALPAAEQEAARPLVARNLTNIEALRKVPVALDLEPAFGFMPPRPVRGTAPAARSRQPEPRVGARPAPLEDLAFEPVTALAARLRTRQISSTELTAMYLDRLKQHDSKLFCVVTFTEALAREQAAQADREIGAGKYRGPLHGIPYGVKDLFATKGILTTWGAKPYATQVPDHDATAVVRMREAGAVLVAKLATGELAINDLWFRARTRNPWNPALGSSGSSAGPASASAAGLVGFAVGTETGGSIISPAATCGAVGLRPTYGRSSRYGCMTLRWTLDKVGALARTVADTALVLEALHGPDGKDATVADLPFSWDGSTNVKGWKIGYLEREFTAPAATAPAAERRAFEARKALWDAAFDTYRKAGATLVPIAAPDLPTAAMYALLNAEAGAMFDELIRSGGINELADQGPNGRANQLRAARFIPAVDYIRAQRVRTLLVQQMSALFDGVDVFLAPSTSDTVIACNLTGHPAIVVPAGFVDGLPIGLMVTGPLYKEERILQAAGAFEAANEWRNKHPAL
jgi:Asp-tRNA(Asn)/Glu-tRNA(Gln) amidotransferase A subunit family amidase